MPPAFYWIEGPADEEEEEQEEATRITGPVICAICHVNPARDKELMRS